MHEALAALYHRTFGRMPREMKPLPADGSQREYWRLTGDAPASVIGAHGPDRDENRAFLSYSRSFRGIGLPVPAIHAADEDLGIWIEEDLGDRTLFRALSTARAGAGGAFPEAMVAAYERVLEVLPRFQVEGASAVDFGVAYPRAAFDEQSMVWDLSYFKYHFLKLAQVPFREQRLENDFRRLVEHLLSAETGFFLYRDFQSRNILLREDGPWFVDYQGGRRGAAQYDVASLLYDAKADVPPAVRERLLARYLDALEGHVRLDRARFLETWPGYVLIRILQALGAYGYRGFFERKPRFLESVPYAARNLAGLLDAGLPVALPELESALRRIVEAWADRPSPIEPPVGLTVHVASFSYRDGAPPDDTGHGGGFVFDCRSIPNPGRKPQFAGLSGADPEVARFLEALPGTEAFWRHVVALVEAHVENFLERNFSDMGVAFGCTGGQHRSVYFAERLARHLRERRPAVAVRVRHLAEARWTVGGPPRTSGEIPPAAAPAVASSKDARWTG